MGALIDGLNPERRSDLTLLEDAKIQFRDSGIYIQSSSDGKMVITADGTDVDAVGIYGKASIAGVATITGPTVIAGSVSITGNMEITGQQTINLPTTDATSMITIKDSDTFPVCKIDGAGNIKAKGGVSKI